MKSQMAHDFGKASRVQLSDFTSSIFDEFHTISNILFRLIENDKKVLDVGCHTGKLGEKLRFEKDCHVVGIEVNDFASQLASRRLNDLIVADVERLDDLPYPQNTFDVIVFADILEHLREPQKILRFFKEYLKEDGYILVSLPNVANWSIRLKLLSGIWNYKERGLLAQTHLRFYTLKTAEQLIKNCDFKIDRLLCTSGWSWLDRRMPFKNPANLWKGLFACNFIFKAVKSK